MTEEEFIGGCVILMNRKVRVSPPGGQSIRDALKDIDGALCILDKRAEKFPQGRGWADDVWDHLSPNVKEMDYTSFMIRMELLLG